MDETLRAYFAGFIDGEGCLTFKTRNYPRAHLFPIVYVGGIDRPSIYLFKEHFGGYVQVMKRKPGCRQPYNYQAMALVAVRLIDAVYPYLRIKRPQADLIYEYMAVRPVGLGRYVQWPDGIREALVTRMRALNHRGSDDQYAGSSDTDDDTSSDAKHYASAGA